MRSAVDSHIDHVSAVGIVVGFAWLCLILKGFRRWEEGILDKAKAKMAKINVDLASAKGLTKAEARVATKADLIDPAQAWWGLEPWQRKERDAEADLKAGRVRGPFEGVEDLIKDMNV